jgi:hypothetical protein
MTATRTHTAATVDPTSHWAERVDGADWDTIKGELDTYGCALTQCHVA